MEATNNDKTNKDKKKDISVEGVTNSLGNQKNGFIRFVREQGVVGLAVGFVLGGASAKVVSSLTEDIIDPFIGIFISDGGSLQEWTVEILGSEFGFGNFIYSIIDFLIIVLVVYLVVKILHVDNLDKKKPDKK